MWEKLDKYQIVLGSQSPRRAQLLAELGLRFEQRPMPEVDESFPAHLPTDEVACYIARKKAVAYAPMMNDQTLLITADTVVVAPDGQILGKPKNEAEAKAMLQKLSHATHRVITGMVVKTRAKEEVVSVMTEVTFGILADEQIDYYIAQYRPMDKAGAYGIQEWIGYVGIEKIAGSFYNVMGLPVYQLTHTLMFF